MAINNGTDSSIRQAILHGSMNDGHIAVSFSDKGLEVYADFIPPVINGSALDNEGLTAILNSVNIVYGINWDAITASLNECNMSRRKIRDVLIARGDAPESEIAEFFRRDPLLINTKKEYDSRERINHRDFSPFTIVKKGQVLAKLKPRKPGKEGMNVHGEVIPFGEVHPAGVSGGENTHIEGDAIVADIHGQLLDIKNVLSVQENLIIKGAVGYRTGNIVFPGDVKIDGPVSDGFKIFSGGSLTIKQTLDLTEVVTKGDIVVNGGIIGKGTALIKSGGEIRTRFIENCRVAARNSVFVEMEIINSNIFTMDTVQMSEKGKILGGDIYSIHGLRTGGIGKKGGKATSIHCGIDFSIQQEKEKYNNQLHFLSAKLARLRELMEEPGMDPEKQAKMDELLNRLKGEQQAVSAKISELMGNINADENAVVEVLGDIAPGTMIEICQVALFVEEPLSKIRIRLDKAVGKLVTEPL